MYGTFKQLVDLSNFAESEILTCPSYDYCEECMNHEIGSFHYRGPFYGTAIEFVFITQGLEMEKHSLNIEVATRSRDLSSLKVYNCEVHGPWIEHRAFRKGFTYVKKLRISTKQKQDLMLDGNNLKNEIFNFERND
jgi:hypothetical protein